MRGTTTTTVREARTDEFDEIRGLRRAAYRLYRANLPAELFEHYLAGLTDLDRSVTPLVALLDGTVVGTTRLYPAGAVEEVRLPADWAWLRALAIRPDVRGAGIAGSLVAECIRRARAGGATVLSLHTTTFMRDGIRIYERLGFRRAPEWDVTDHYGVANGGGMVALAYRLDLTSR